MMEETFHCPVCKCDISDEIPMMFNEKDLEDFGAKQTKYMTKNLELVNEQMELAKNIKLDAIRYMRTARMYAVITAAWAIFYSVISYLVWAG